MSDVYEAPSSGEPKSLTIHEFPPDERPREKLKRRGVKGVSDAELVAILLRTGRAGENVVTMSQRLISFFENLRGLAKADFNDLVARDGISVAKACQILAAFELGRRADDVQLEDHPSIKKPEHIFSLFSDMANLNNEHFRVMILDTKNQVKDVKDLYVGTVNASLVRPAEVFHYAVRLAATSIAVVHNHPSGDPSPSNEDIEVTKKLMECGEMLGIELVDHIIIGYRGYVSLRESGVL